MVRSLRRAGYVARRRWPAEGAPVRGFAGPSYTGGPVEGCPRIDPWRRAEELLGCCRWWHVSLYAGGDVGPLAAVEAPRRCRRNHVCPVCAASQAMRRAAAVRAVVGLGLDGGGPLVLATFTQRARVDEPLVDALNRWRRGWALALGRGGRVARRRRDLLAGYYYGVEVTRGAEGRRRRAGKWWHVHGHALLSLVDDEAEAKAWLRARWASASETAAVEVGAPGHGWDPVSGETPGVETPDRWWIPVDREDPVQVYQAAKYPTPAADLHPVPLAEFVAAAYRRQWHQAGGTLYGVMKLAEELDEGAAVDDGDGPARPSLGERVSTDRPGTSPDPADQGARVWRWELRAGVDPLALRPALVDLGGRIDATERGPVAVVPASAGRRLAREANARIAAWRLLKDAIARGTGAEGDFMRATAEDLLACDLATGPHGA